MVYLQASPHTSTFLLSIFLSVISLHVPQIHSVLQVLKQKRQLFNLIQPIKALLVQEAFRGQLGRSKVQLWRFYLMWHKETLTLQLQSSAGGSGIQTASRQRRPCSTWTHLSMSCDHADGCRNIQKQKKTKKQPCEHVKRRQTNRETKRNQTSRWCSRRTTRRGSDVWFSEISCGSEVRVRSVCRAALPVDAETSSQTGPVALKLLQQLSLICSEEQHVLTDSLTQSCSESRVNGPLPHTSLPPRPATLKPQPTQDWEQKPSRRVRTSREAVWSPE